MVDKVEAYKTTDGALWITPDAAHEHQKALERSAKIVSWVRDHCTYNMDAADVIDILEEHGDELGI